MENHTVGWNEDWGAKSFSKKLSSQIEFENYLSNNGIDWPQPTTIYKLNNDIVFKYSLNGNQKIKKINNWRIWFKGSPDSTLREGTYLFQIKDVFN